MGRIFNAIVFEPHPSLVTTWHNFWKPPEKVCHTVKMTDSPPSMLLKSAKNLTTGGGGWSLSQQI